MGYRDLWLVRQLERIPQVRRWLQQRAWAERWQQQEFSVAWRLEDFDPVIAAAVADGWFPPGARILDVGCGDGVQARALAGRGFRVLGVDIAAPAIRLAQSQCGEEDARFEVLDICLAPPAAEAFDVILDRGCFHQLAESDRPGMAANLLRAATEDARLLLMVRGFNDPREEGLRPEELGEERKQEVVASVRKWFAPACEIVDAHPCCFDVVNERAPGWAIRLQRVPDRAPRPSGS